MRMFAMAVLVIGVLAVFAVNLVNAVDIRDASYSKCPRMCLQSGWKCIGPMTVCNKAGCTKTCESYQWGCVKYGRNICTVN